jgi:hypothetical protein
MGIYTNVGNDDFRTILNDEYVDKSLIISKLNKRINARNKLICISRPRRFGKSTIAQMLCAYYDKSCDSSALFKNLKIANDPSFEENLNKYPVIYLDMTWFTSTCGKIETVLDFMTAKITKEIKEYYPNANGDSLAEVIASAAVNYKSKFIIIIDEWDAIFREAKNNVEIQKAYVILLRSLFKSPVTNKMIALGYMTGILPIKKYGTQSALTDFKEYTMIDPGEFAEYTGFTEDEVKSLCQKYGRDFEKAKQWYNGYSFSSTKAIYNPNSIMQCMISGKYQNYWTRTESYESLKSYIDMDFEGIKQDLIQMIGGEECKVDTNSFQNDFISLKTKNDVFTLLIHLGYLAFNSENNTVHIPNNEIREEFVLAVKDGSRKEIAKLISSSEELIEFTLEEKSDKVASLIEKVHSQATSPTFYNNEQALRSTIRFAYIAALDDYVEIQELPSGKGYADIVYIPKKTSDKPALIIELKWNKSSEGALNQIKQNNYPEIVKQLSGDVLLVGINYDEKTKNHKCTIEKLKK